MTRYGRPPQATNGSFVDTERGGPGPVVRQLRSGSMGWYGSGPASQPASQDSEGAAGQQSWADRLTSRGRHQNQGVPPMIVGGRIVHDAGVVSMA